MTGCYKYHVKQQFVFYAIAIQSKYNLSIILDGISPPIETVNPVAEINIIFNAPISPETFGPVPNDHDATTFGIEGNCVENVTCFVPLLGNNSLPVFIFGMLLFNKVKECIMNG